MRILHIVECAYRATIEEQDDAAIWFAHMLSQKAGADCALLLRGNAVNYLNKRQRVDALRLGDATAGALPRLCDDVAAMIEHGIPTYYVDEDAGECGMDRADMIAGARPVARNALARLVAQYERVFHW
jgi:DsrE/DsrF-like family